MATSALDAATGGYPGREDEVVLLARFVQPILVVGSHLILVADALKDSGTELRKGEETRTSQYAHAKPSDWHKLKCATLQ